MSKSQSLPNSELIQQAWQLSITLMPTFSQAESTIPEPILDKTLALFNASALIIVVDGQTITHGTAPTQQQTTILLSWLSEQTHDAVYCCDHLDEQFPDFTQYPDTATGLLALGVSATMDNCIIWLRHKAPKGRALTWSETEIQISYLINASLSEAVSQKSLRLKAISERDRLNFIINNTPALIGYWDVYLINRYCNTAYSKWFGESPDTIRGKHIRQVLGDALYQTNLSQIEAVMHGEAQLFDRYITDQKTHKTIHTQLSYIPDIVNGQVKGFYVLGVDVTDQDRIIDLSLKNTSILKSIKKGVVLTNDKHQVIYTNPAFEEMTGYSLTDLYGHSYDILKGPNSDPVELELIERALTTHQDYQGEIVNYRKDGSEFWNELNINPIFDRHQNISQFIYFHRDISNRKRLESELSTSENQFRSLANSAPVLIWLAGLDKLCYWFNDTWLSFTGRSMEEENGNGWADGVHPEDFERCLDIYITHFDKRLPFRMEYRLRRYDGEYRWIDDHGVPRFNHQGEFEGYIGSCTDVTDIRNSKTASDFFNVSHEIIYSTDLKGHLLDVNSRFLEITGYSREEVIGKNINLLKSGIQDRDFYAEMWHTLIKDGFWNGEITNINKTGRFYSAITSISTIKDTSGQPMRYLAIASDITALVESRDQLEKIAFYDNLTKLPNRALLMDRLEQAMVRVNREGGLLAVLFIDLDGFKQINDNYGHDIGDKVLITLAHRMKAALRKTDSIGRLGGDEFIVILQELSEEDLGETPINHLLEACSTPIIEDQLTLCVSSSIGAALFSNHPAHQHLDSHTLIKQADQAMYVAKQAGKNGCHYFNGEADTHE